MAGEQEIDQQKAALLAAIAQQGSQGQVAFDAEAARRAAAQQAAVAAVNAQSNMTGAGGAAPAAFTAQLQGQTAALGDVYAQDAAMSNTAFKNSLAQTSASNAAYMDQARAALPVVQAQTAGTVAQIRAEQEAAAAERAYQAEQRRIDAEEAQKERDFAQWQRDQETADATDATTDEEDAVRVNSLLSRAAAKADPVTAGVLGVIHESELTFQEAVSYANSYVDQQKDPDTGEFKSGFDEADRRDLFRYIYEYYTGKKAPGGADSLGDAIADEGGDGSQVPGYVPPSERPDAPADTTTTEPSSPPPSTAPEDTSTSPTVLRTALVALSAYDPAERTRLTKTYDPFGPQGNDRDTQRWIAWVANGANGTFS